MTANHRALEKIDIELIERIKLSPCLYDTRNPDFRLVYKKDSQWNSLADSLGMSFDEARRRWTVLRDRYARELKQMQLNPKIQSFGKNEFFCRMDFLRSFVKKRRVRKKIGKKKTLHTYAFETVEIQPQSNLQVIEESQESEMKYVAYVEEQKHEVSQDPQMENNQVYEQYVEDSYETVIMENQDTSCNSSISNAVPVSAEMKPTISQIKNSNSDTDEKKIIVASDVSSESEEQLFSKVIASYLKNLSRRHKIKAKVEMMQILEKYIDIEESERLT